jgi:F-type H+-transporting ATPase subunit b
MELVTPNAGTIFWMVIIFGIVAIVLKKFAWKPILHALDEREESIENALSAAREAREEVDKLNSENQRIIAQAKDEKEFILQEAMKLQQEIILEAKEKATAEAQKSIELARHQIMVEQAKALSDMKKEMTEISFMIAEKIIRKELADREQHRQMVDTLLDEIKLN